MTELPDAHHIASYTALFNNDFDYDHYEEVFVAECNEHEYKQHVLDFWYEIVAGDLPDYLTFYIDEEKVLRDMTAYFWFDDDHQILWRTDV